MKIFLQHCDVIFQPLNSKNKNDTIVWDKKFYGQEVLGRNKKYQLKIA